MNDLVSIVVTTHHEPIWMVEKCLNSLYNSTYKNNEIIIVNDCSQVSGMAEFLEYSASTHDNVVLFNLKKNAGFSKAKNIGMAAATGEYLMFVDSDMEMNISFIENAVKTFESHDDCWHVYGNRSTIENDDDQISGVGWGYFEAPDPSNSDRFIILHYPIIGSGLVKRSDYVECCGFDETKNLSDVDLIIRMFYKNLFDGKKQYPIEYSNISQGPTIFYYPDGSQVVLDCIEYKYLSRYSNIIKDKELINLDANEYCSRISYNVYAPEWIDYYSKFHK